MAGLFPTTAGIKEIFWLVVGGLLALHIDFALCARVSLGPVGVRACHSAGVVVDAEVEDQCIRGG